MSIKVVAVARSLLVAVVALLALPALLVLLGGTPGQSWAESPKRVDWGDVQTTRAEAMRIGEIAFRDPPDDPNGRCRLDVFLPKRTDASAAPTTTIVWLHAGGLTGGGKHFPRRLIGRDRAVIAVGYRLVPAVDVATCIDDAAAAVAWAIEHAADYGGDPNRIIVAGHSAGGYLTLMLGLDRRYLVKHDVAPERLMGLAALSGHTITHFTQRKLMGLSDTDVRVDAMAPLFHLSADAPPILCVTGDREKEMLGRFEENAYFVRMMQIVGHKDITLHELGGFDHGAMVVPGTALINRFAGRLERALAD